MVLLWGKEFILFDVIVMIWCIILGGILYCVIVCIYLFFIVFSVIFILSDVEFVILVNMFVVIVLLISGFVKVCEMLFCIVVNLGRDVIILLKLYLEFVFIVVSRVLLILVLIFCWNLLVMCF